jgi:hypothetical protein
MMPSVLALAMVAVAHPKSISSLPSKTPPTKSPGTRDRIDLPPRHSATSRRKGGANIPHPCPPRQMRNNPLLSLLLKPLSDRKNILLTSSGMTRQSLPPRALYRAHKKWDMTKSSIKPIAIGPEDINGAISQRINGR